MSDTEKVANYGDSYSYVLCQKKILIYCQQKQTCVDCTWQPILSYLTFQKSAIDAELTNYEVQHRYDNLKIQYVSYLLSYIFSLWSNKKNKQQENKIKPSKVQQAQNIQEVTGKLHLLTIQHPAKFSSARITRPLIAS